MYQKVVVPLDGSDLAECVLPHVEALTKGCGIQNVMFVRVVEPFYAPGGADSYAFSAEDEKRINSENKTAAENYLAKMVKQASYDGVNVQSEVLNGKAAESIADYATKNEVDLIIIATHGRSGISRWIWGSVADRVLRSSCVPVVMVRAPGCVPGI
jgi:nucleotide-binding universal stress UspA family protein